MDRDVKQKAIRMLRERKGGSRVTYEQIAEMTGYSVRQLYRISDKMDREGDAAALEHAAAGRRSNNAASEDELRIIRETKAPYPTITIRHFHDIYHGGAAVAGRGFRLGPSTQWRLVGWQGQSHSYYNFRDCASHDTYVTRNGNADSTVTTPYVPRYHVVTRQGAPVFLGTPVTRMHPLFHAPPMSVLG